MTQPVHHDDDSVRARYLRPDAGRYIRPDAIRFIRPDAARIWAPGTTAAEMFPGMDLNSGPTSVVFQPGNPAAAVGLTC
ncbi:MAG: hypothetical protein NT113_02255 [Hyphomicrobiales bacterium]|jgi:hypothetical protein|nr:hypothetical protein [Hyphomicrobiales bacterium]